MCGIAGFLAPKANYAWRKKMLSNLLVEAAIRGKSATGIAFIDPEKGLTVVKDGKEANEFIKTPAYIDASHQLPQLVIGHARGATGGAPAAADKNENNHPFFGELSKIALIHNGVITDDAWRKTVGKQDGISEKYPFKSQTDSELILRLLETCLDDGTNPSMIDALSDTLYNIEGSFTLAVIRESEPNKLWLVRHKNPLVLAYNDKNSYLLFGSTKEIIEEGVADYFTRLDFFLEKRMPKLWFEEVAEDHILEISILDSPVDQGELFNIKQVKFTAHADRPFSHSH